MNIQQLEYVMAVNTHRHFARAAESCHVTQPTLSMMIHKLEEECGVKILKNKDKLCRTYHIYELNNKIVLKKTNWYDMTVKGSPKLIPQKEEGITKAEWLGKNDLKPVLKNTYPLILDVLTAGGLI